MRLLISLFLMVGTLAIAQTRIIPHVTRVDGGFESRIILANLGETEGNIKLVAFDEEGEPLAQISETVGPNETLYRGVEELFKVANVSHFTIEGDSFVSVSILYKSSKEGSGPAHVRETSESAYRWRIYLGDRAVTWDGLVVVNMSTHETPLSIFGYTSDGRETNHLSPFWPLKPMEKEVYFLSDLFESTPEYFEFLSADPITVMALRGELESKFLWENAALPMAFDPTRK